MTDMNWSIEQKTLQGLQKSRSRALIWTDLCKRALMHFYELHSFSKISCTFLRALQITFLYCFKVCKIIVKHKHLPCCSSKQILLSSTSRGSCIKNFYSKLELSLSSNYVGESWKNSVLAKTLHLLLF